MVASIHKQVADFSIQAAEAVGQKQYGKAVCLVVIARITSAALLALQILSLVLTAFRYVIQSFITAHYARKAPFPEGACKALSDWCKADIQMQFIGVIQALGATISPELFCNTMKLQKSVYTRSIKMDVAMTRMSPEQIEGFKKAVADVGQTFDRKSFEVSFCNILEKNALEANEKSQYGTKDVQSLIAKSCQDASVAYFQEIAKGLTGKSLGDHREKVLEQLFKLTEKKVSLTPQENERLEFLKALEPKGYELAMRLLTQKPPARKPLIVRTHPKGKPTLLPVAAPKVIDSTEFIKQLQNEEEIEFNEQAARLAQAEEDAQAALAYHNHLFSGQGHYGHHGQHGRHYQPTAPTTPPGTAPGTPTTAPSNAGLKPNRKGQFQLPDGSWGTKQQADEMFDKILKETSMHPVNNKHLSKEDETFGKLMLASMQETRKELVKKDIFNDGTTGTDEKIADCIAMVDNETMYGFWRASIYNFYGQPKATVWKSAQVVVLGANIQKNHKEVLKLKDTAANKLLNLILTKGKDPASEKQLIALRKSNPALAKLIDSIFIDYETVKKLKEVSEPQEKLKTLCAEFKNYKNDVAEMFLLDFLAKGQTPDNKEMIDQYLKSDDVEEQKVGQCIKNIFNYVGRLVSLYERQLFSTSGLAANTGIDWNLAYVAPVAAASAPVPAPAPQASTQPKSSASKTKTPKKL